VFGKSPARHGEETGRKGGARGSGVVDYQKVLVNLTRNLKNPAERGEVIQPIVQAKPELWVNPKYAACCLS